MHIFPIGPYGLKRGEMKSDKAYKIHLVRSFKGALDNTGTEHTSLDRRYDPFHHRVTPIETFVSRTAELVHRIDQDAQIGSERSGLTAPRIAKTLTLQIDDRTFTVSDRWPAPIPTPSTVHDENRLFLESAQVGVAAFAKAVAERWPILADGLAAELGRLEKRLRSNCHHILSRAERHGKVIRARAARDGLTSVPSGPVQ